VSDPSSASSIEADDSMPLMTLALRGCLGGVLMGLANLVPGISGGTMLLAAGVYPAFIAGIAEVSTLRFRTRSIVSLASIVLAAVTGILLLAGTMKELVTLHRWVMYSLFIGLTLGGLPLIWRLARPITPAVWSGAAVAFGLMVLMALAGGAGARGGEPSTGLLFLSGLSGAAAMILPGVSGGYLLLLLGQYEVILGGIDQVKQGLLGGGGSDALLGAAGVVIPVGLGVVVGVVGVSNLLRWLLRRHAKVTLGALLGLLLGAVVGLWPFQQPVAPEAGDRVAGRVLTPLEAEALLPEDWPLATFSPTGAEVGGSLGLIAAGLSATILIARIGGRDSGGSGGNE